MTILLMKAMYYVWLRTDLKVQTVCQFLTLTIVHNLDLHLLRLKRKEQIETAEKVLSVPDYTKQFKAITMLLDALFPVS